MPKLVDHEERRRLIAQATWRVISRDGVRAASVRTVAAEAGLSTGALRHYFDDHASLLLFAARHSLELMAVRVFAHLSRADAEPRATVQACLEELLPLDGQRAAESAVYFGLIDHVRFLPEHTAFREVMFGQGRRLYRLLVGWLAGGPQPTPEMLTGDPSAGSTPDGRSPAGGAGLLPAAVHRRPGRERPDLSGADGPGGAAGDPGGRARPAGDGGHDDGGSVGFAVSRRG